MSDDLHDPSDEVFRLWLSRSPGPPHSLRDFYRDTLRDLLQIVRLFSNGHPVIVDAFAFLDDPNVQIPLTAVLDDPSDRRQD